MKIMRICSRYLYIGNQQRLVKENTESSVCCVHSLLISIISGKKPIRSSGCARSDIHVFEESSRRAIFIALRNAVCFVGPLKLKHGRVLIYVYSNCTFVIWNE